MYRNERLLRSRDAEVHLDELVVRSVCRKCLPDTTLDEADIRLVSPRGVVHEGRKYGETWCGKDATGPGWWWAL